MSCRDCSKRYCNRKQKKKVIYITKKDFRECGYDVTYRITSSGNYELAENIKFHPIYNKISAISIEAKNVTLDLCGHFLRNVSNLSQITGIVVKSGHENVTILGTYGSVENFTKSGIYVEGDNKLVTIGDDTRLSITGCGRGTPVAYVDGGEGVVQCGLQLGDQKYLSLIGVGSFNGPLSDITIRNVIAVGNNTGCYLGEGKNYEFSNCSFSQNSDNRLVWETIVTLGGFYRERSVVAYGLAYFSNPLVTAQDPDQVGINNIVINGCKFNENLADASNPDLAAQGSYCNAFLLTSSFTNLKVKSSQFNKNKSLVEGDSKIDNVTLGLVIGAGVGTVVEDSEFSDNVGGSEVVGCSFSGLAPPVIAGQQRTRTPSESTTVRRCVAARNVGRTSVSSPLDRVDVRGFSLKYPSGATMIECVSEDNQVQLDDGNKDLVSGFCDGIFIFGDRDPDFPNIITNNVEIKSCKISRNRVVNGGTAGGLSNGIAIVDDLCENVVIRDCVITRNSRDLDEPGSLDVLSSGIDAFQRVGIPEFFSYVTVCNNLIQSNGIILDNQPNGVGVDNSLLGTNVEDNKISDQLWGISTLGECGTIVNNRITRCQYAVRDFNGVSTTLVSGNQAYATPCGFDVNYAGPTPTLVEESTLPDFPLKSDRAWANIQINNNSCEVCLPTATSKKKFDEDRLTKKKVLLAKRFA